ncbi:MAG: CHASE2 domain-containing protein [Pseudomonadota bacterium]
MRFWRRMQVAVPVVAFAALALLLSQSNVLERWDNLSYDAILSLNTATPSQDIFIIAIDDASIDELGPWPWPRSTHAALIDRLAQAGTRAIALDVLFSEPDRFDPSNDELLAKAIARHGRVVLPVFVEQLRLEGQLREVLPIPLVSREAAGFGHIHLELESDGIARRLFLKAGLGDSYWSSLPLSLSNIGGHQVSAQELNEQTHPLVQDKQSNVWVQSHLSRIPFVGPVGSFQQISYTDVVHNRIRLDTLRDGFVLIGITSTGSSDRFPTPTAGSGQLMPGVEVFANVLNGILKRQLIRDAQNPLKSILIILPIVALLLLFPRLMPRASALATGIAIALTFIGSYLFLTIGNIWLSPVATVVTLLLTYPILSWIRLESTLRYVKDQIGAIDQRSVSSDSRAQSSVRLEMEFFRELFSLDSWALFNQSGELLDSRRWDTEQLPPEELEAHRVDAEYRHWWPFGDGNILGVKRSAESDNDTYAMEALTELVNHSQRPSVRRAVRGGEVVLAQVERLKRLTEEIEVKQQFSEDSLSHMADGVVVFNRRGSVLVVNYKARELLNLENIKWRERNAFDLFRAVAPENNRSWQSLTYSVVVREQPDRFLARKSGAQDLYVQMTPLQHNGGQAQAIVVTFSDITEVKATERRRAEILSFLSHDLRSPLVSILALTEVADKRIQDTNSHGDIKRIENYTRRALGLSEQFVELIRAEIVQPHNVVEIDLADIATNAVEQLWDRAKQKHIRLVCPAWDTEFITRADPELLERALVNLLDNAIKYSPDNTEVTLSIEGNDTHFKCEVADQGCGIAEEAFPTLFDLYQRIGDAQRKRVQGSGLGLAFVKAVADRHGGAIHVASEVGVGTTMTLEIPRVE